MSGFRDEFCAHGRPESRLGCGVARGLRRTPRPTTDAELPAEQLLLDLQPDVFDDGLSFLEWMVSLRAEGGQSEPVSASLRGRRREAEQVTVPGECLLRAQDSGGGS